MNRYVAEGVARDVEAGKRVILVAWTVHTSRHAFDWVAKTMSTRGPDGGPSWSRRRMSAGNELIEHESGGWLRVVSKSRGSFRGLTADVIVVVDGFTPTNDVQRVNEIRAEMQPTGAEIIRGD